MPGPLHHQALSDLLYRVIPRFTESSHDRYQANRDPKSFFLQFNGILDHLLEHLVINEDATTHHSHPRLESLRHYDPSSTKIIAFSEDMTVQTHLITILEDCRRELEVDRGLGEIETFIDIDTQYDLPQQLLQHAKELHTALSTYWSCNCAGSSRAVNLQLKTFMTPGPDILSGRLKFDMLFSHQKRDEQDPRWQEGEVVVYASGTRFDTKKNIERIETIRVDVCSSANSNANSSNTHTTICQLIAKSRRSNIRVKMNFKDSTFAANTKREVSRIRLSSSSAANLESLNVELRNASKREVNELALILACTLLHLYDDKSNLWLSTKWVRCENRWRTPEWTKQICFFKTGQGNVRLNFSSPYLPSRFDDYLVDEPFEDFEDALGDAAHEAPSLLALGATLLQLQRLHLGIEDLEADKETNINTNLTRAQGLLDRLNESGNLNHWFAKAVTACISESQIGDNISMRNFIYKEVVYPLKMNLLFYSPSLEQLENHLKESLMVSPHQAEEVEVCLYGDTSEIIDPAKKIEAENWQKKYSSVTKRVGAGRPGSCKRIKIAILDTGICLTSAQTHIVNERHDMVYKSFLKLESDEVEQKDSVGHGTHLAGTLAIIAPEATLYVARVFAKRKPDLKTEAEGVAKAINWAIDKGIDIIVMSFGFVEEQPLILEAIERAYGQGITMFAAASNDGANREDNVSWPAKIQEVICVHSGSGQGTKSPFTPDPSDNHRVMVLGECVRTLGVYMSGTSCAAPVAAGIAACILDYAKRVGLRPDEILKLRKTECMREMFKIMKKEERRDYWWIMPWAFFEEQKSNEWIAGQMRRAIK